MEQAQSSSPATQKGISKADLGWAAAVTTIFTNIALTYSKTLPQDEPSFLSVLLTETNIPAIASIVTVLVTFLFSIIRYKVDKRRQKVLFLDKIEMLDDCIEMEQDPERQAEHQKKRSDLIARQIDDTVKR